MYKITIKGEAHTEYQHPEELNGIDCEDNFSEYFGKDEDSFSDNVTGGYMDFVWEDGKLMTRTIYDSTRELTQEELNNLADYTQGQWSDGIGEGFEQQPVREENGEEIYISPWRGPEQELIIKQEKLQKTESNEIQ